LVAPPRFSVEVDAGALVFTAGTETKYARSIGFRVYDTFSDPSGDHQQLVAVFDSQTGSFRGLVVGRLIGALRTAAINAVAIKYMARSDAKNLGILGSGFQAGFHTQAAMVVRQFQGAKIYSPNVSHREAFAADMSARTGIPIEAAGSAEEVVRFAEVLICATTSASPMLEASWVAPGTHVNTIGPKFKGMAEIPYELAQKSRVIATDSLQQVDSYSKPFFLLETPERERMLDLSEIVAGKQKGRLSSDDVTLFCSVGLAGTEVVVADEALRVGRQA
jgi:alanine dehydrogenase